MITSAEDLRYPVGRYKPPPEITPQQRTAWIAELEEFPRKLRQAVTNLCEAQLATPYRPGGWTVRQVIHHLPDSHINSYTRFRLALTEDAPLIKPYQEAAWAELADAAAAPVEPSLLLLAGLHARWTHLLKRLSDADFARTFRHPELGQIRLDWTLGLYAWHGGHHLAQISNLSRRENW
jgi:hypothetical protein